MTSVWNKWSWVVTLEAITWFTSSTIPGDKRQQYWRWKFREELAKTSENNYRSLKVKTKEIKSSFWSKCLDNLWCFVLVGDSQLFPWCNYIYSQKKKKITFFFFFLEHSGKVMSWNTMQRESFLLTISNLPFWRKIPLYHRICFFCFH